MILTRIHHEVAAHCVVKSERLSVRADRQHTVRGTGATFVRYAVIIFVVEVGEHHFTNVRFCVCFLS